MAATTFGSLGKYGLTDEALKGIYAANMSATISSNTAELPDHQGDVGAFAIFGERTELSLGGVTVAAGASSQAIAALFDTANTDIYGDGGASTFAVTGITLTRSNTDFETAETTGIGFPGITVT